MTTSCDNVLKLQNVKNNKPNKERESVKKRKKENRKK